MSTSFPGSSEAGKNYYYPGAPKPEQAPPSRDVSPRANDDTECSTCEDVNKNKKNGNKNIDDSQTTMVTADKAKVIATDLAAFAAVDAVRGRQFSGSKLGRLAVSDFVYEYGLDTQAEAFLSTSFAGTFSAANNVNATKVIALPLTHALVSYLTGGPAPFNAMLDGAQLAIGGVAGKMAMDKVMTK